MLQAAGLLCISGRLWANAHGAVTMGEWAKEGSAVRGEGKETNEGIEKGREE